MSRASVPFIAARDAADDRSATSRKEAQRQVAAQGDVFHGPFHVALHGSFEALEPSWRHAERNGHATPFQTFDWLVALRDCVAQPRGIETFVAHVSDASGRSVMILPLVRERRKRLGVVAVPDFDVCDYLAPVLFPGPALSGDCIFEIMRALRRALRSDDVIDLRKMPPLIAGRANPLLALRGVRKATLTRSGLSIAAPASDLMARTMKASTFRDFSKFRRRLLRAGDVRFVEPSTLREAEDILDAMIAQRRNRFMEMGRENLMDLPEIEHFYRRAALDGLNAGPVRIFGLSVGGHWVATSYGLVHDSSFALLAQTMEGGPWRKLSPGLIVTAETMEWSVANGLRTFDFTIGLHGYKKDFGAAEDGIFEVLVPLSFRGQLAAASAAVFQTAKSVLRQNKMLYASARRLRDRVKDRPRKP